MKLQYYKCNHPCFIKEESKPMDTSESKDLKPQEPDDAKLMPPPPAPPSTSASQTEKKVGQFKFLKKTGTISERQGFG